MTDTTFPQSGGKSLGRTAADGAFWLAATQIVRLLLMFGATVVIARLLSPADYGIVAMVTPILALVARLQDFGLNSATVQAKELSDDQSTTLFWICVTISLVLATILILASPSVARFYGDPRVTLVAALSAVAVFIGALGLQHSALLNRHMQFKRSAMAEIGGLVATYGSTLALAFAWRDYWSLVWGTIIGTSVQTILTWIVQPFRPGRPQFHGGGHLLRFGGQVAGFNLSNFLVRNADTILVGRFGGAAQVGLYDRSYKLLLLPLSILAGPLARLLQPILRELRDDPARYRRVYLASTRSLSLAIMPVSAATAVFADRFMTLVLGDQWGEAGPVYFWLALAGLMQPVSNPLGLLFMTTDRTKAFLNWGLFAAAVNLIAFAVAAPFGARGMAIAVFTTSLLLLPLRQYVATRGNPVRDIDLYREQLVPALAVLAVAFGCAALMEHVPIVLALAATAFASTLAALAALHLVSHDSRELNRWIIRYVREHLPRPGRPESAGHTRE